MNSRGQPSGVSLEQERERLEREVLGLLRESETVGKVIAEKQMVVQQLLAGRINVLSYITEFNWIVINGLTASAGDILQFHHFNEIYGQKELYTQYVNEFEQRFRLDRIIIGNLAMEMQSHLAKVNETVYTITTAKDINILAELEIPDLNWLEEFENPEIDGLATEWAEMNMEHKMNLLLQELCVLLHIN